MKKTRVAFVDLLFNWPPLGGAAVDLVNVISRASRLFEVALFVPRYQFFSRKVVGEIRGDLPFPVFTVPFDHRGFTPRRVAAGLRREVERFAPHKVFIGHGFFFRPELVLALRDYAPLLRLYAYENICGLRYGTLFKNRGVCPVDYLDGTVGSHRECLRCVAGSILKKPASIYAHQYILSRAFTRGHQRLVREALGSAGGVVVYNRLAEERISPLNPRVFRAPTGIDFEMFSKAPKPRAGGPPLVLAVGRMEERAKGFHHLVWALDRLWEEKVSFRLAVTGHAPWERPYLTNLGWVDFHRMPAIYAGAAVLAFPSLWEEPFGITVLEAMASGLAVVCYRSEELSRLINHGVDGFIVEKGDRNALYSTLKALLSDRALARRAGENARETARAYDWDAVFEKYYVKSIYRSFEG